MQIPRNIPSMKKRPYQAEAIRKIVRDIEQHIHQVLNDKDQKHTEASLLEMATGSGKTFTVGKTLDLLFKLRNRYYVEIFSNLHILVLSNRIDGVEQFRDDLIHGKADGSKAPILSSSSLSHLEVSTFHSRADNLDEVDAKYYSLDDDIEIENFWTVRDSMFFSTWQTAELKKIEEKIGYFDIIIIDETHNVRDWNLFEGLIERLSKHGRKGQLPYILPITATPTNLTQELFWEPIFCYSLAEYLASKYSPTIEYRLVTKSDADDAEIARFQTMIEDAKNITENWAKRDLVREIKDGFEQLMMSVPSLEGLVEDLLIRLMIEDQELSKTILYARNTQESDAIVDEINRQYWQEISVSYHSKTKKDWLQRLQDESDSIKIVVAVNMLNESIDLPSVSNVVFWRGTEVAKIFLQQFWRWLRWDFVRYYDYVWGMKNFAWIGDIHEDFLKRVKDTWGGEKLQTLFDKFKLLGWNLGTSEKNIDLSSIGFEINSLENSLKLETFEDYRAYFEANKEELERFGVKFSQEWDQKIVDLNVIDRPKEWKIFWFWPKTSLMKLNRVLWDSDSWLVKRKDWARKILAKFFEKMGYRVAKEKSILWETFEAYKEYFIANRVELEEFGVKFSQDGDKKIADLNRIKAPKRGQIFWNTPKTALRKLNQALWNSDKWFVTDKNIAKTILRKFFERMEYRVACEKIKEKVILASFEDYREYFESNWEEFALYGVKLFQEWDQKLVDLDEIKSPSDWGGKIFWYHPKSSLRQLNKALWNSDEWDVINIDTAKKIFSEFFIRIGYGIMNRFDYYKLYFKTNKQELEEYGVKFFQEWNQKIVDLKWIKKTQCKGKIFWDRPQTSLKKLNQALWNSDQWLVTTKEKARKILAEFFGRMGYRIIGI